MTKSSKVLRKIISDFYMVLILIFLYAPILTMMVLSFNKSIDKDSKDTKETLTVEEKTEQFEELTEKLAMLGIPVFVDRSSEEKTELGKKEWIKVYGVLYGCEELTNEKFDAAVAAAEK